MVAARTDTAQWVATAILRAERDALQSRLDAVLALCDRWEGEGATYYAMLARRAASPTQKQGTPE